MEPFIRFDYYSNRLRMCDVLGDVHVDFARARTAEEKFAVTHAALAKYNILPTALVSFGNGNPVAAQLTRNEGNDYFRDKKYFAAIYQYTSSLLESAPGSECWAYALANRSAALFHDGHYLLCLKDVDRALASRYPAGLAYKLYERAGHAERALGRGDRARRNYEECLRSLDGASLSDGRKDALRAEIAKAVDACDGGGSTEETEEDAAPDRDDVPLLLMDGPNERVPALSCRVELKCSENMGRGVYATCDINPGDIVAVDEPYLYGPRLELRSVCHHIDCLKFVLAAVPCPKCVVAIYCDDECMQKAYEKHNLECSILRSIFSLPGTIRVNELVISWFLRECSQIGLEKYCSVVNHLSTTKIDPLTRGFDENGLYKTDSFLAAYTVDVSENKLSMNILFFLNCVCAEMTQYLILSGFDIPKSYLPTVGASLVHMFKILDFNCWKINKINSRRPLCLSNSSLFSQTRLALYTSICLFNHSCDANVINGTCLSSKRKVLKAIQPIPKGKQLFISYGCSFRMSDKETRRQYCWDLFKSECFCQPCLENWPTERYCPNSLSLQNVLNPDMASELSLECDKFAALLNIITIQEDYEQHINYFYSLLKLLFFNVKRPFYLYEECVQFVIMALVSVDKDENYFITKFYEEIICC